ncbi:MAG: hypothetical protein GY777_29365 [Candidatus Brocadiaceae bacterium]|nr:hypothetical protein [Candidatus Brocadiaceae bacterium]
MNGLLDFVKVVKDCTGGNAKIKQSNYLPEGLLPVVDQGQEIVAGFIDDESMKYKGDLPCVIFGDHTCILKYVDFDFVLGADGTKILVPDSGKVNVKYLYYFLNTVHIPNRGYSRHFKYLKRCKIPVVSLSEQKQIVQILDTADTLRQKRKEQLNLLDDYLKSVFFEMFGDPVINEKGWKQHSLSDVGEIQGGLQVTTKRRINPIEVPYLRVANVYRDRLNLNEIKVIKVTKSELQRTNLCLGDILIVEGHGNRTEIGRTSVWDGSIDPCVHQNHLIRIRINMNIALPIFISNFLNSDGGRRQLFSMGKTTSGLNTISTSNVKALKVILPPLEFQKKYQSILNDTQQTKQKMRASLDEMDNHFNALMQRYFG